MSEIPEAALAEDMGLPRELLREMRGRLEKGVHWHKRRVGIVYTDEGMSVIRAELSQDVPFPIETGEVSGESENATPALIWVRLTRFFPINQRVMEGVRISEPGGPANSEKKFRVRVRDARIFGRGMELPCLPTRQETILRYAGPMPQGRGRLSPKAIEQYLKRMGVPSGS